MPFQTLPGLRIMMYHSIGDTAKDRLAMPLQVFEEQIAFIAGHYEIVSLRDALANINWRRPFWGAGKVVLTFDDAYRDFLLYAAPVLRRYAAHATLFVPTRWVGQTSIWHSYDKTKPLLTWDELRDAQQMGFDIASHTVSHCFLTTCSDDMLQYELVESLRKLREEIQNVLPCLSYPGGYFGRREIIAAQMVGYVGAVGVTSRLANYPWTNRFHLRRCQWHN